MAQPASPALHAGRRPGQLQVGRRRRPGGDALHGSAHGQDRARTARRHRQEPSISAPTTTGPSVSPGPAGQDTEPADQRLLGDRGRYGDNIPPHNLQPEVINACVRVIEEPGVSIDEADGDRAGDRISPPRRSSAAFTACAGVPHRARKGLYRSRTSSRTWITVGSGSWFTSCRTRSTKARLLEKIAELVKDKDRRHLRAARWVRQGRHAHGHRTAPRRGGRVVLNNLFQQTQMQNGVRHQRGRPGRRSATHAQPQAVAGRTSCVIAAKVVTRRTLFDLRKAREAPISSKVWRSPGQHRRVIALIRRRRAQPNKAPARRSAANSRVRWRRCSLGPAPMPRAQDLSAEFRF